MDLKKKVPVYESEEMAEIEKFKVALDNAGIENETEESLMTFPFSFLKRNSIKLKVDIIDETRAFGIIDAILQDKKQGNA